MEPEHAHTGRSHSQRSDAPRTLVSQSASDVGHHGVVAVDAQGSVHVVGEAVRATQAPETHLFSLNGPWIMNDSGHGSALNRGRLSGEQQTKDRSCVLRGSAT